ncbi:MAG TPA: aminotransferase class III-fold pyridoxal phosphate-dependent enzyme [bacterium]|nr:aminotransferase class III-fold pyridoxal phosphate-dependent enzyme [bacterium]
MAQVFPAAGGRATADLTREHVLIPWEAQGGPAPQVIDHAQGCDLYTSDGARILDFSSGLVNVNIGHSHPRVVEAIRAQAGRLTFVNPSFSTDVRARLAQQLARLSPGQALVKTFFTNGGAEANENAVKIARLYTGRHKVLTSYRGYHGATYGAITLSGDPRRWPAEPGVPGVIHFLTPYPYRSPFSVPPARETEAALAHLEHVLMYEGPEHVAAILIETIVGGSGLIVPPDGYLEGIRKICDRHGILLIFDEVMAGFGRTGAWFACEHWNVVPDMITFAKGITSGYVPLGGVLVSRPVARHFDDHILWAGLTYSGHALACAAGCANLDVMEDEGLVERARRLEGVLGDRLRRLADRHRVVGDVRGKGLFWGVELVKDRETREPWAPFSRSGPSPMKALLRGAFDRGVYLIGRYNIFMVAPPLVITEEQIEEGVQAIDGALAEAAG